MPRPTPKRAALLLCLVGSALAAETRRPLLQARAPPQGGALRGAATKLCTTGLLASTGQPGGFLLQNHVRGIVFGGMDGILTTFALLAAVAGSGRTSTSLTLVIGISTVLADALSMGAGEYLSAKAELELDGSKPDPSLPGPLEKGVAMFLAFTLFGAMPLLGYVATAVLSTSTFSVPSNFVMSCLITALTLFVLGAVKSQFGEGDWLLSGLEVSGIGGAAACVAYFTASIVDMLMGEPPVPA